MKWARNIVGVVAVLLVITWIVLAVFVTSPASLYDTGYCVNGQGVFVAIYDQTQTSTNTHESISVSTGEWFVIPLVARIGRIRLYVIPHWLVTAIAGTAYVILWRKAASRPLAIARAAATT